MSTQFKCQKQLYFKQFRISTLITSISSIDRTLSCAPPLGQSGTGSDGNKVILCIPQNSSVTGASPPDFLMLYVGQSLGVSYPTAGKQSVYSASPADFAKIIERKSLLKFN